MTDAALLVAGAPRRRCGRASASAGDGGEARAWRWRRRAISCARRCRGSTWATGAVARDAAPVRRAIVRRLTPWLQRGEGELGPWASRLVRPLLFDRARDLGSWAIEKLQMWRGQV